MSDTRKSRDGTFGKREKREKERKEEKRREAKRREEERREGGERKTHISPPGPQ